MEAVSCSRKRPLSLCILAYFGAWSDVMRQIFLHGASKNRWVGSLVCYMARHSIFWRSTFLLPAAVKIPDEDSMQQVFPSSHYDSLIQLKLST
jgi:hypothetical protein